MDLVLEPFVYFDFKSSAIIATACFWNHAQQASDNTHLTSDCGVLSKRAENWEKGLKGLSRIYSEYASSPRYFPVDV